MIDKVFSKVQGIIGDMYKNVKNRYDGRKFRQYLKRKKVTGKIYFVFCSGMYRSASTWSYNVARLLMQQDQEYKKNFYYGVYGKAEAIENMVPKVFDNSGTCLYKFHEGPTYIEKELLKNNLAKNIYTIREPLRTICSCMDFFNWSFKKSLGKISRIIAFKI